jgi:imidazole glycerol-phosphate synthase subunit HisH
MKPKATIVDYGVGNLHSAANAFLHLGAEVEMVERSEDLERARCLVLPGVGAFGEGMAGLHQRGLVDPLRAYAASGRSLLGICLGAQLLMSQSEEFGRHEGLGIVPGNVQHLPVDRGRIPHIGWSQIVPAPGALWEGTLFGETAHRTWTYFVHSYHCLPAEAHFMLATAEYNLHQITAAIRWQRTIGVQFHPEKSGTIGLSMLRLFLEQSFLSN